MNSTGAQVWAGHQAAWHHQDLSGCSHAQQQKFWCLWGFGGGNLGTYRINKHLSETLEDLSLRLKAPKLAARCPSLFVLPDLHDWIMQHPKILLDCNDITHP